MRTTIRKYAEGARMQEARVKAATDLAERSERERAEAVQRETSVRELAAAQLRASDEALGVAHGLAKKAAADLELSEGERVRLSSQALLNEERARGAEEKLKAAGARVAELEAAVEAANKKAEKAVEDYKESTAFEADVAAASVGVYYLGFADCRSQFGETFPGLDIGRVAAIGEPEAGEIDEGGGAEGATDAVGAAPIPTENAAEARRSPL